MKLYKKKYAMHWSITVVQSNRRKTKITSRKDTGRSFIPPSPFIFCSIRYHRRYIHWSRMFGKRRMGRSKMSGRMGSRRVGRMKTDRNKMFGMSGRRWMGSSS